MRIRTQGTGGGQPFPSVLYFSKGGVGDGKAKDNYKKAGYTKHERSWCIQA